MKPVSDLARCTRLNWRSCSVSGARALQFGSDCGVLHAAMSKMRSSTAKTRQRPRTAESTPEAALDSAKEALARAVDALVGPDATFGEREQVLLLIVERALGAKNE